MSEMIHCEPDCRFCLRFPAEHFPWQSYVSEEMEARGWGRPMLARQSGLTVAQVDGILDRGLVAAEYAPALERAFGVNAQTWINLQMSDLDYLLHKRWRELASDISGT